LNIACFIYIGAWLPFSSWEQPELGIVPWRLIVLFFGILFLRRIPVMLAIFPFVPDIHNWREALFCGHFGPMGVGAVFISTLAMHKLPEADKPPNDQVDMLALSIQPIVSFVVLCSILVHGLSIPFFNVGRQVGTYTYTWSKSRRSSGEVPEWLSSMRRVVKDPMTGTVTMSGGPATPPHGAGQRPASPIPTEPAVTVSDDRPAGARVATTSELEKGEIKMTTIIGAPAGEQRAS